MPDLATLILSCTDEYNPTIDYGTFMEICDELNRTDRPSTALAPLHKRLTKAKDTNVLWLSLSLTDFIVKNVPGSHVVVGSGTWQKALSKLATSKKVDVKVSSLALSLIQLYAHAFQNFPSDQYKFVQTYEDLRKKGTWFAPLPLEDQPPVFTPPATAGSPVPAYDDLASDDDADSLDDLPPSRPSPLESGRARRASVGSRLDALETSQSLLHDIVSQMRLPPGQKLTSDEVADPLGRQGEEGAIWVQQMLSELMGGPASGTDEETVARLLALNDLIRSNLDALESLRLGIPPPLADSSPAKPAASPVLAPKGGRSKGKTRVGGASSPPSSEPAPLIDFSDASPPPPASLSLPATDSRPPPTNPFADMDSDRGTNGTEVVEGGSDDEFDAFFGKR